MSFKFGSKFPKRTKTLSIKEALVLSVLMHLLFMQLGNLINFDNTTGLNVYKSIDEIVVELSTKKDIRQYKKNSNDLDYKNKDNSSISDESIISNSSATNGLSASKSGNITQQRQQLIIASLHAMNELKSPFNFISQQLDADSAGVFSPVPGFAPDTESLSRDLNGGILKVAGFGRGDCPPRGGKIIKVVGF